MREPAVDPRVREPAWAAEIEGERVVDDGRFFAIEIFSGSAGLTAALSEVGFNAVGIDRVNNEHRTKARVISINLATESGRELLERVLAHPRLAYAHLAPPCGTASHARE